MGNLEGQLSFNTKPVACNNDEKIHILKRLHENEGVGMGSLRELGN